MPIIVGFLLVIFSTALLADPGLDPKTDMIADNYDAGNFLIYDCLEKHWTCVTEDYFKQCESKRKKDLRNPEAIYHTCAPVGSFPTKRSCFQRQLFMTSQDHGARFCVKDEWKLKAVDY
jgi:hypothetical protein